MVTERAGSTRPYPVPAARSCRAISELAGALGRLPPRLRRLPGPGPRRASSTTSRRCRGATYGGAPTPSWTTAWHGYDLGRRAVGRLLGPGEGRQRRRRPGLRRRQGPGLRVRHHAGHRRGHGAVLRRACCSPTSSSGTPRSARARRSRSSSATSPARTSGNERWGSSACSRRSTAYDRFLFFDHVYLGGGNSKHLDPAALPAKATIVPNTAGIIGGVRLWDDGPAHLRSRDPALAWNIVRDSTIVTVVTVTTGSPYSTTAATPDGLVPTPRASGEPRWLSEEQQARGAPGSHAELLLPARSSAT